MYAADGPSPKVQRLIVLHELDRAGSLGEAVHAEDFAEIAAVVTNLARHDLQRTVEIETPEFHYVTHLSITGTEAEIANVAVQDGRSVPPRRFR
jgi:hypothetical protein